uniref:Putative secreted protein n=1 Tax=Anopheles darlingi TaxID=43151 RepID=A0A2M4DFD3_ANODA
MMVVWMMMMMLMLMLICEETVSHVLATACPCSLRSFVARLLGRVLTILVVVSRFERSGRATLRLLLTLQGCCRSG